MTLVAFDDIPALAASITEEYGPWGDPVTVTQEMINQFADITGDHQWIHVDVQRAAKESPFGGPIAHGFLTLSLIPDLVSGSQQITGYANATNYGAESLRFLSPVPSGSSVRARTRLASVSVHPRGGTLVTRDIEVGVVGSERPALVYRMQVLYR
jgi:acyl dehydratase